MAPRRLLLATTTTMLALLLVSAVVVSVTSSYGSDNNSYNSPFIYSHSIHYNVDHIDSEPQEQDNDNSLSTTTTIDAAAAAAINKPSDTTATDPASVFMHEFKSSLPSPQDYFAYIESDQEDEDDDDDNDGHSSMLSNASVQQRNVYVAATRVEHIPDTTDNKQQGDAPRKATYSARVSRIGGKNSIAKHDKRSSIVALRGGAEVPPVSSPTIANLDKRSISSPVWQQLVTTALVTLIFEGCLGHLLEFAKIVMQTSPPGTTYAQVFDQVTSQKGFFGLWDAFVPWGVVQAVLKGAVFGLAHATASSVLLPWAEQGILSLPLAQTLAGGIGGGIQGYVLSPTLLLKTRVMTNSIFRSSMSVWRTIYMSFKIGTDVVLNEGAFSLLKGANVFALKRVFDWASRYYFADLFEDLWVISQNGQPLTLGQKSIASILGGVASTCVTLPLDVLVAKMQDSKQAGVRKSALKMFTEEVKEKGFSGMRQSYLQGFEARLLHVCLTTVVVKTGTPVAHKLLFGSS